MTIHFHIPGQPVGKGRPRIGKVGDYAFGPQCARAMFGAKPKRAKREPVQRDDRTADLFEHRG